MECEVRQREGLEMAPVFRVQQQQRRGQEIRVPGLKIDIETHQNPIP